MQIIRDLKAEVRDTTAAWHRDRTAKAHGAMTSARSRLALARWLIRAGISIEGAPGGGTVETVSAFAGHRARSQIKPPSG